MFPLFRNAPSSSNASVLPRRVEVVLTTFARGNRGLFTLDGPAIGTDPGRTGNALDVYCLFDEATLPRALSTARSTLANVTGMKISYHSCASSDGSLLNKLSRRAKVCISPDWACCWKDLDLRRRGNGTHLEICAPRASRKPLSRLVGNGFDVGAWL
jgi:hypothetical protein